jgi:ABC-type sugar transport system ATPase subunit
LCQITLDSASVTATTKLRIGIRPEHIAIVADGNVRMQVTSVESLGVTRHG